MKKHLLALAALATVSGVAVAQNVTIYGVADAGVMYTSKTSTAGASKIAYNNGGMSPSIFGFKGSEDLGGGLKANFNLEAHYSTSTGETNQWNSALFGRQANVGLSSNIGTVTLGKQYYPAVLAFAATDPRGLKEQFSGLMTWALGGAGNTNQAIDVFSGNAVSYSTTVAGVNIGALYGIGGVADDNTAGRQLSFGATYTGPVTLSAAYQSQNGTTANTGNKKVNEKTSFGIGYTLGAVTLKANWMNAQTFSDAGVKAKEENVYGVGANYAWNANNTVTLAYYQGKKDGVANSTGKSTILSNDYSLSKRTVFYTLVAIAKADSGATAGVLAAQTGVAGLTNTAYQAGIKHSF